MTSLSGRAQDKASDGWEVFSQKNIQRIKIIYVAFEYLSSKRLLQKDVGELSLNSVLIEDAFYRKILSENAIAN